MRLSVLAITGQFSLAAKRGLEQFDEMLATAANAPERRLVDIDDVGGLAAFLRWNRPPNNMCCNGEMKKTAAFRVVSQIICLGAAFNCTGAEKTLWCWPQRSGTSEATLHYHAGSD
jgi:NAD(P)-dependent dehydrogenase (short-subunit alcohol dehydrogenase family)